MSKPQLNENVTVNELLTKDNPLNKYATTTNTDNLFDKLVDQKKVADTDKIIDSKSSDSPIIEKDEVPLKHTESKIKNLHSSEDDNEDHKTINETINDKSENKNTSPEKTSNHEYQRTSKNNVDGITILSLDEYNRLTSWEKTAKKVQLYHKLADLERMGISLTDKYTINSSYEEMVIEYELQYNIKNKEHGISFMKQMLITGISGLEFLNKKFDPFGFDMNGFTNNFNIDLKNNTSYHQVIGELYDKYKGSGTTPPEIKLIMMIGASAAAFHLNKKIQNFGGLGDMERKDPRLLNNISNSINKNIAGNSYEDKIKQQNIEQQRLYNEMIKQRNLQRNQGRLTQQEMNERMRQTVQQRQNNIMKRPNIDILNKNSIESDKSSTEERVKVESTHDYTDVTDSTGKKVRRKKKSRPLVFIDTK